MGSLEKSLSGLQLFRIALNIFKQLRLRFYYMTGNAHEIIL